MYPFNNLNPPQGMPYNPNFSGQNPPLGNPNGANPNNFNGLNPNHQPMAQNNAALGVFQLLVAQLQRNPQLQMGLAAQLQNQNNLAAAGAAPFLQGGYPFMGQVPNQFMPAPNAQFMTQSPMLQGNQMMGLLGNPLWQPNNVGLGFGNVAGVLGQPPGYACQDAGLKVNQQMSNPAETKWNGNAMLQNNPTQPFQVNHSDAMITGNSSANFQTSTSRGPAGNYNGFGRKPPHNRFQKSKFQDMRSPRENKKQFKRSAEKGQEEHRELTKCTSGVKRPLHLIYTTLEIRQWREARKRNYPTKAKIKKVSATGKLKDSDGKLRSQQLKEVLARQAELGVEVAEIPPDYLGEPVERTSVNENERKVEDRQPAKKFDRKRGEFHGSGKRYLGIQKFGKEGTPSGPCSVEYKKESPSRPPIVKRSRLRPKKQKFRNKKIRSPPPRSFKREPSLLQKLLSADMKRDQSRLLQVFRFMVLNDFFRQSPEKPLEFPVIILNGEEVPKDELAGMPDPSFTVPDLPAADEAVKNEVVEGSSSMAVEIEQSDEESDDEAADNVSEEEDDPPEQLEGLGEEGEITD